jgi:hypothetical protein
MVCNAISATRDYAELSARTRELLPQLGMRSFFVCIYDTPGDSSQARLLVSSAPSGADPALAGRAFRGRDLLPPEFATVEQGGRAFAVLPLVGPSALLGHVLFEYTAGHAFTCGAVSEAMSIALRNFPETKRAI